MSISLADLEIVFGSRPFDYYTAVRVSEADVWTKMHWNPNSPLTKAEQKKELVQKYITLGQIGRKPYYLQYLETFDEPPPEAVPRDLFSPEERRLNTSCIMIRTWYGRSEDESLQADCGYSRLLEALYEDYDHDREHFQNVTWDSRDNPCEAVKQGTTPDWLLNALCHYPDIFQRPELDEESESEDELALGHEVLVYVADREACEKGWMLVFELNHKGHIVLPILRRQASRAMDYGNGWIGNGESLGEFGDNNGELWYYAYPGQLEDGWARGCF